MLPLREAMSELRGKRKGKKNQTFVPVLQQRQLQEGFQSKILQINFVGGSGVEIQRCVMICDSKGNRGSPFSD